MRVSVSILFLTLVVNALSAQAAPTTKTTLNPAPLSGQSDPLLADKTMSHDQLPSTQLNLAVGFAGGDFLEGNEWRQGPTLALRYSPLDIEGLPQWDLEGQINKDNLVGAFLGKRFFITQDDYLPYVRIAAGTFFDAKSEFANVVEIKRWRARAGLGIGAQFNFELGAGVAVTGIDMYGQLGYNFNF
ncbi:MAG TPA: hypothetical protein VF412_01930 [Bdellovibrio sp.]